ncbi:TIR domain-containing protein [Kitasatospora sp. YST-16]|uniref:toll/interleukin-1 receptor domain-containing protein n=1 Tax=Kitasatospora sp. YST-16 TaxID=2998080 RepID=UPI0022849DDC|nr:toll/interleukin-1 receptor domain-containing protein [Kitasatospora sp. YST-16]WAL70684.1 TIR domain-containing protein [Kitasatospora sp. YST-16]WNW36727.1 TIR domain-containing protein [Streptomyces sp. Li-HN-5-13]
MWDVFLSYSRADRPRVEPLVTALEQAGLRVFVDHAAIPGFEPISATIREQLARSTVLLAFYSAGYPHRPACQWELTAAYLAGWHEGDPRRRVLVVNPEPFSEHIHPIELRDARHWPLPASAAQLSVFAAEVRAWILRLDGPLPMSAADLPPAFGPGPRPMPSPVFTGRLSDLWRVHSTLSSGSTPLVAGPPATGTAVLHGPAGIGKTLLAQEYALRFGPAFPGGVYWFDIGAAHHTGSGQDPAAHARRRFERQLRAIGDGLGVRRTATDPSAAVRSALGHRRMPYLWVVDGLPSGLSNRQVLHLCAPDPNGRTLLTTRSMQYSSIATPVEIVPLASEHAYTLLTVRSEPGSADERGAARQLADDLGGHPLALDLVGSAAQHRSFTDLLTAFHTPGPSLLDAAAKEHSTATDWPGDITEALVHDTAHVGRLALDVLRIGAALSPSGFDPALVGRILLRAEPSSPTVALRRARAGLSLLRAHHLIEAPPNSPSADCYRVSQVTAHALAQHDPDPARAARLRHMAMRALREPHPATLDDAPPADATGFRREHRMPGQHRTAYRDLDRMAAFDLQTELVLRIGVQRLDPDTGSLREALTSLHSLFPFTRSTLRQYNIGLGETSSGGTALGVPALADRLLNGVLRPFLSRWHPALAAHEAARPPDVPALHHEQRWSLAPRLRADLNDLGGPLNAVVLDLAAISGADFDLPSPPKAPAAS